MTASITPTMFVQKLMLTFSPHTLLPLTFFKEWLSGLLSRFSARTYQEIAPTPSAVELDTTLRELYSLDSPQDEKIIQVYAIPSATTQMTSSIPLSTQFAYQSPRALKMDSNVLARTNLQAGPQSYGFVSGNMPLVLFDVGAARDEATQVEHMLSPVKTHQADALKVFDQLAPAQRPELRFVSSPTEITMNTNEKVAIWNPMDCLTHLPHLFDPEMHYELLSKRGLAISEIPTPKSDVIDCNLQPDQTNDESLLKDEVERMMKPVNERAIPFVIKLPQSLGSQGVFVVQTDSEKQEAIGLLNVEVKRMIQQINESNKHMRPASIVLQEIVPGTAVALSLFVTIKGRSIFTGCTEQIFDNHGHWDGGCIDYKQQDNLRKQYADIAQEMATYMHQKGYYGPLGADVMTNLNGKQLVIDLNVRVPTSYPLGFLKKHFSVQRGLHDAALLYPLALKGTRDDFQRRFDKEIREGKIVICGWCNGSGGPGGRYKYSISSVAVGGETPSHLRQMIERINVDRVRK